VNQHVLWSHQTELAPDAVSAPRARAFITRHLVEHATPAFLVDDIQLVGTELATNALRHARTSFTVTLSGCEDAVRLDVRDGSPKRPRPRTAGPYDTGGRGLAIVGEVSHAWGVAAAADGTKSVWASFDTRLRAIDAGELDA
jgi:anti-sigma regulatory factor (Ser/Thr protein kinase)